jgi:hypothetical protein
MNSKIYNKFETCDIENGFFRKFINFDENKSNFSEFNLQSSQSFFLITFHRLKEEDKKRFLNCIWK